MVNSNLLKNLDLFQELNSQEINKLAKIAQLEKIEKGKYLFKKGDTRDGFFVIVSGFIKLIQNNDKSEGGWAILKSQDFISANSLIIPKSKHSQTACADEDSELLMIKGNDYIKLIKNNNKINNIILSNLIQGLNQRLKHSTIKLVTLYRTGKIASNTEKLALIGQDTLKAILKIIQAKKAAFCIINKYKSENTVLATIGFTRNNDIVRKTISIKDDTIIQQLIETKDFYNLKENDNDIFLESIYKMKKCLAAPLIFDNKVIGMILLGDKKNGAFSKNNEILLELIANQISGAVYRAQQDQEVKGKEVLKRIYITN